MAVQGSIRTPTPGVTPNSRAERALRLFEERAEEIRRVAHDLFEVPSCSGRSVYTVHYGGLEESWSCPDFAYRGEACKHLLCVGIMHAARRSGIRVRTISVAGDPFKAAARASRSRSKTCPACFGGYVTIGVEEDGDEHLKAVPCRRCHGVL